MISALLDTEADLAAGRYELLTDSLQNLFAGSFGAPDAGAGAQTVRVVADAYQIAETWLGAEKAHVTRVVDAIAREAHRATLFEIAGDVHDDLAAHALEHLSVSEQYLLDELIAQIHRDIALVRQTLQGVILDISMRSRTRQIPVRQALIEYRVQSPDTIQFAFIDRSARRWTSKRFVRTVWRHTLLAVYNEVVMITIADHGLGTAAVVRETDDGLENVSSISLTGEGDLSSYAEIRAEIFHPNSNARLALG